MLPRNKIAAIHIAKNKANLSDAEYRAVLQRVAGVSSCKNLKVSDVNKVLDEIKRTAPSGAKEPLKKADATPGWKYSQVQKFKQYARFCRIDLIEARALLFQTTGAMNEEAPTLKQVDFDDFMAAIEAKLEDLVKAGKARVPEYIQLRYWRNRHPNRGGVNTRESHLIFELWKELEGYLSEEKRNSQYLLGFAAHTCNLSRAKAIQELSAREALKVIDALRRRLVQEQNKLAAQVPF